MHENQLSLRLGLVIDFHVTALKDGVSRVVNDLRPLEDFRDPPDLHA